MYKQALKIFILTLTITLICSNTIALLKLVIGLPISILISVLLAVFLVRLTRTWVY